MSFFNIFLLVLYGVIVVLAITNVVLDNRQPAKTMAWALVIWFVPVIGIMLYLFFGVNTRKKRHIGRTGIVGSKRKVFKNNDVEILTDGKSFIERLLDDVRNAKRSIDIDIYIIEDDETGLGVVNVLMEKTRQGVLVRLIYDDVGCWSVRKSFFRQINKCGIDARAFLPVHFKKLTSRANYRNHRKLIIVDGEVGYIGGMNIAHRYVKGIGGMPWRDTMLRVRGDIVEGMYEVFSRDWVAVGGTEEHDKVISEKNWPKNNCRGVVVTSGPFAPYPEIMQELVKVILKAKKYIFIETPYFLPSEIVMFALKTASLSGVDIRVMVPRRGDAKLVQWAGRTFLREVMDAGVKVYLYERGFLHSKLLVADDILSSCGSANMDFRSFENNFEANIFFWDNLTALRLKAIFMDDMRYCINLFDINPFIKSKFLIRLWESLMRLFAPLL